MRRSFIIFFSSMLTTLIVIPSIISLVKSNAESILVIDFGEEENNKDGEKEIEEKEVFFQYTAIFQPSIFYKGKVDFCTHVESDANHDSEIHVPPPRIISHYFFS